MRFIKDFDRFKKITVAGLAAVILINSTGLGPISLFAQIAGDQNTSSSDSNDPTNSNDTSTGSEPVTKITNPAVDNTDTPNPLDPVTPSPVVTVAPNEPVSPTPVVPVEPTATPAPSPAPTATPTPIPPAELKFEQETIEVVFEKENQVVSNPLDFSKAERYKDAEITYSVKRVNADNEEFDTSLVSFSDDKQSTLTIHGLGNFIVTANLDKNVYPEYEPVNYMLKVEAGADALRFDKAEVEHQIEKANLSQAFIAYEKNLNRAYEFNLPLLAEYKFRYYSDKPSVVDVVDPYSPVVRINKPSAETVTIYAILEFDKENPKNSALAKLTENRLMGSYDLTLTKEEYAGFAFYESYDSNKILNSIEYEYSKNIINYLRKLRDEGKDKDGVKKTEYTVSFGDGVDSSPIIDVRVNPVDGTLELITKKAGKERLNVIRPETDTAYAAVASIDVIVTPTDLDKLHVLDSAGKVVPEGTNILLDYDLLNENNTHKIKLEAFEGSESVHLDNININNVSVNNQASDTKFDKVIEVKSFDPKTGELSFDLCSKGTAYITITRPEDEYYKAKEAKVQIAVAADTSNQGISFEKTENEFILDLSQKTFANKAKLDVVYEYLDGSNNESQIIYTIQDNTASQTAVVNEHGVLSFDVNGNDENKTIVVTATLKDDGRLEAADEISTSYTLKFVKANVDFEEVGKFNEGTALDNLKTISENPDAYEIVYPEDPSNNVLVYTQNKDSKILPELDVKAEILKFNKESGAYDIDYSAVNAEADGFDSNGEIHIDEVGKYQVKILVDDVDGRYHAYGVTKELEIKPFATKDKVAFDKTTKLTVDRLPILEIEYSNSEKQVTVPSPKVDPLYADMELSYEVEWKNDAGDWVKEDVNFPFSISAAGELTYTTVGEYKISASIINSNYTGLTASMHVHVLPSNEKVPFTLTEATDLIADYTYPEINTFLNDLDFSKHEELKDAKITYTITAADGVLVEDLAVFTDGEKITLVSNGFGEKTPKINVKNVGDITITAKIEPDAEMAKRYTAEALTSEYKLKLLPGKDGSFGFTKDGVVVKTAQDARLNLTYKPIASENTYAMPIVIDNISYDLNLGNTKASLNDFNISYKEAGSNTYTDSSDIAELVLKEDAEAGLIVELQVKKPGELVIKVDKKANERYRESSSEMTLVVNKADLSDAELAFNGELISTGNWSDTIDYTVDETARNYDLVEQLIKPEDLDLSKVRFELMEALTWQKTSDDSDFILSYSRLYNSGINISKDGKLSFERAGKFRIKLSFDGDDRYNAKTIELNLEIKRIKQPADSFYLNRGTTKVTEPLAIYKLVDEVEELNKDLINNPILGQSNTNRYLYKYKYTRNGTEYILKEITTVANVYTGKIQFDSYFDFYKWQRYAKNTGTVEVFVHSLGNENYESSESPLTYKIVISKKSPTINYIGMLNDKFTYSGGLNFIFDNSHTWYKDQFYPRYIDTIEYQLVDENGNPTTDWWQPKNKGPLGVSDARVYRFRIRVNFRNNIADETIYPLKNEGKDFYTAEVLPLELNPSFENGQDNLSLNYNVEKIANNYEASTFKNAIDITALNNQLVWGENVNEIKYEITGVEVSDEDNDGNVTTRALEPAEFASVAVIEQDGTLKAKKIGKVTVKATLKSLDPAGKKLSNYKNISASYTIDIVRGEDKSFGYADSNKEITYSPNLSFTEPLDKGNAEQYGSKISYVSSDPSVATVDENNGQVKVLKAGTVTITAKSNNKDTERFVDAESSYQLIILPAEQTGLKFAKNKDRFSISYNDTVEGETESNVITNPLLGGQVNGVTYVSSDPNVAKVDVNGKVEILTSGSVVITATKPSSDQYNSASLSYEIVIAQGKPELILEDKTINYSTDKTFKQELIVKLAGKVSSNNRITYSLLDENGNEQRRMSEGIAESIDRNTGEITLRDSTVGSVKVRATRAGDLRYRKASVEYTLTVKYIDSPAEPISYSETAYDAETGWFNDNVVITPAEGYEIGWSGSRDAQWSPNLSISDEADSNYTYYLKKIDTNEITAVLDTKDFSPKFTDGKFVGSVRIDKTKPHDLSIEYIGWNSETFIRKLLTFFIYKGDVEAKIVAKDNLSGIKSLKYTAYETTETETGIERGRVVSSGEITDFADLRDASSKFSLPEDFNGVVEIVAVDFAGNSSTYPEDESQEEQIIIDNSSPAVSISYSQAVQIIGSDNLPKTNLEPNAKSYYADDIVVDIAVDERNFTEADRNMNGEFINNISLILSKVNEEGASRDIVYLPYDKAGFEKITWTQDEENPNIHHAKIVISESAKYNLKLEYADDADNLATFSENTIKTASFIEDGKYISNDLILDKTVPGALTIEFEASDENREINDLNYAFYKDKAKVYLTAVDNLSGIDYYSYKAVATNGDTDIVVEKVDYNNLENFVEEFEIPANFEGYVEFSVTNLSGLSNKKTAPNRIVIDNKAPGLEINFRDTNAVRNYQDKNYYSGNIELDLLVDEKNFYEGAKNNTTGEIYNDFILKINHVDVNGNTKVLEYVPVPRNAEQRAITWTEVNGKHKASIILTDEGTYSIDIAYVDASGNAMKLLNSTEAKTKASAAGSYSSQDMVIDRTKPVLTYEFTQDVSGVDGFYKSNRILNITVEDQNFRAADFNLNLVGKDITGALVLDGKDFGNFLRADSNWKKVTANKYQASIELSADAYYTLNMAVKDLADNRADDLQAYNFVIDKTAPVQSSLKVSYSDPVLSKIISAITFGYYKSPVKVTLQARDETSRVTEFNYSYGNQSGKLLQKDIVYSDNGRLAKASFEIPAQFRDKVAFNVVDKARNASAKFTDNKNIIVVDNIAPTRTLSITPDAYISGDGYTVLENGVKNGESGVNRLLLNGQKSASLTIKEENFYPEDVSLVLVNQVSGAKTNLNNGNWQDLGNGSWKIDFPVNGADGQYRIESSYSDRSGNTMVNLVSDLIIIDKTAPKINMSVSPGNAVRTIGGRSYYAQNQSLVIEVVDANFRADDFNLNLTGTDFAQNPLTIANYNAQLRNRANWIKNGNVNRAVINLNTDANYTISASAKDLAGNSATTAQETLLTVDKQGPTNLSLTTSEPVRVEGNKRYYQSNVRITVTGVDSISSIHRLTYNFASNVAGFSGDVSSDRISYSNNGRTANFTIALPNTQTGGTLTVKTYDRADNVSEIVDQQEIIIDSVSPVSNNSLSTPSSKVNDIYYYNTDIRSSLNITETNFIPANVEITVSYNDGEYKPYAGGGQWTRTTGDNWVYNLILPAGKDGVRDGSYKVRMRYTDPSGNLMPTYTSPIMILDTKNPVLTLSDLMNDKAYKKEEISFEIVAEDTNIDPESFDANVEVLYRDENGEFKKDTLDWSSFNAILAGQKYQYYMDNLALDGAYTIRAVVRDYAGNESSKIIAQSKEAKSSDYDKLFFTVNRKGSVFFPTDRTKDILSNFYHKSLADDLVFTEISVNKLHAQKVMVNNEELIEGEDYEIILREEKDGWYHYDYIVDKDLFKSDNDYDLVISSIDETNTEAYSDIKGLNVNFTIDNMAPIIIISGVEDGGTYASDTVETSVAVTDDGGNLSRVIVKVLNNQGEVIEEYDLSGEDIEKEMQDGRLNLTLKEGFNLAMLVESYDEAGNMSSVKFDGITVSTNAFILWYSNTPLFVMSIILLLLFILLLLYIIYRKMKEREEKRKAKRQAEAVKAAALEETKKRSESGKLSAKESAELNKKLSSGELGKK